MKCAACLKRVRRLQRAIVLRGPGRLRPGMVCVGCARNGWLLVLGADDTDARDRHGARRVHKRANGATQRILDGAAVGALASALALAPATQRCDGRTEKTRKRCRLLAGHIGRHVSILGNSWESAP